MQGKCASYRVFSQYMGTGASLSSQHYALIGSFFTAAFRTIALRYWVHSVPTFVQDLSNNYSGLYIFICCRIYDLIVWLPGPRHLQPLHCSNHLMEG